MSRYFGVFPDETIRLFYANFDRWEISMVVQALSTAGCHLDGSQAPENRTLVNVPQPVVYHILCNPSILQEPSILSYLRTSVLPDNFSDWPTDPPPPGVLLLLMDENPDVRRWAQSIALNCRNIPIPRDDFIGSFEAMLEMVSSALTTQKDSLTLGGNTVPYAFAPDSPSLWAGFLGVLRLVPVELLTSSASLKADLRRIVTGHLHNTGPGLSIRCTFF